MYYKIYKIYGIYKYTRYKRCITRCTKSIIYTRYTRCIKKYKIDRRYPSQYNFYSGVKNRQLAKNLSFWYDSKNIGKSVLIVQPH